MATTPKTEPAPASNVPSPASATATTTVTVSTDDKPSSKKGDKLVVRLLTDYWDAAGVRHSAAYVDDEGEHHITGALVELPADEARKLIKTPGAERGDEY